MSSEAQVQNLIHRLEEGQWAKWVRIGVVVALCLAALLFFIFDPLYWGLFRGLSHPKAMEQAQIAREVARGNGFSTLVIRPLAMAQITKLYQKEGDTEHARQEIARRLNSDTYHAPLWPAVLAPFLKIMESKWDMDAKTMTYHLDKMIIAVSILLFYAAVIVNFLTVRRLFDGKLGMMVVGLVLLCYSFWSYAISGLPQMLMFLLFSLALYTLVRAFEARQSKGSPLKWLIATSFFFGLLALTHPITLWAFVGALVVSVLYFRPRVTVGVSMAAVVFLMFAPWMVRNYKVCGSPFGVASYSLLFQVRGTEAGIMRSMDTNSLRASPPQFRTKIQNNVAEQLGNIYRLLGSVAVAPLFFVGLMHLFRKPETRAMRWALFSMWGFSVFGMAVAGFDDGGSPVAANDLHLLFVPLFSAYGLAFLLVLWNRREVRIPYLRTVFIGLIFFVSAIPLINFRTASLKLPFWWPPYAPPAVARLNKWVEPNEIILSDMPWAVAWYANRKSFWIPEKLRDFIEIHDYARLQQPFAGLFLTPITGNAAFMGEVLKGEYKEWAPLILRSSNVPGFPFKQIRPMEIKGENVFFSDRNRWLHEGEVDEELMPAEEQKDGKKNKEEGTEEAKPETKAEEKAEEKPENKAEEVKDSPAEQPGAAQ